MPIFKTKLKVSEVQSLFEVIQDMVLNKHSYKGIITPAEYYTLRSVGNGLRKRLAAIDIYRFQYQSKLMIFKVDFNQYHALQSLYRYYQTHIVNFNPYYDNLFRFLFIEFDKQKISLQ